MDRYIILVVDYNGYNRKILLNKSDLPLWLSILDFGQHFLLIRWKTTGFIGPHKTENRRTSSQPSGFSKEITFRKLPVHTSSHHHITVIMVCSGDDIARFWQINNTIMVRNQCDKKIKYTFLITNSRYFSDRKFNLLSITSNTKDSFFTERKTFHHLFWSNRFRLNIFFLYIAIDMRMQ